MIRDLVAIFGVIAGFSYYVLTVKATRRNQDLQLETRQAQLFSQWALYALSSNFMEEYGELLNYEWEDYHDFETKYGSDNNPRAFAMRNRVWGFFSTLGKYLREGLIDIDLVNTLISDTAIFQWYKWKDIIYELRKRYYTPITFSDWEYLVTELLKYKTELGYPWEPPTTLSKYIPDQ